jgi:hypothetical protein
VSAAVRHSKLSPEVAAASDSGAASDNGGQRRLLTRTRVSVQHRPWQPTRARRGATLPLTVGPHMSAFFSN